MPIQFPQQIKISCYTTIPEIGRKLHNILEATDKKSEMTKLLEWISVLSAFFAVWYSLIGGYVKHPLIEKNMTLVLVSPIVFVLLFGLYAVTVILYRVFTFNNCEEAAKELQEEIKEARQDLQDKGLRW